MPSTLDYEAIRKAARKSRVSTLGGRKTVQILRQKAATSPDYAVIANPARAFHSFTRQEVVFRGKGASE